MIKTKKSATYYILIVIFLSLLSRLLGLGRDTFIGNTFGAGNLTDAYFTGINLTVSIFLGIGSGVATTLVPIVVKYRNRDDKPLFKILVSLLMIAVLISALYFFISPAVIRIYASEYNETKIAISLAVMRRLLPSFIFIVMTYFFVAILQGNEIFILPAAIGIPFNMLFFLYLIFYNVNSTVIGLAVVTSLGWALQMLVVAGKGIGLVGINKSDYDLKKFYLPLIMITIVALMHNLNLLIDNYMSHSFGDGGATSIQYGNMLFKALASTIVYGITSVMFPKFTKKLLNEKREGLNKSVVNLLRSISMLLVPMSVGLIILGDEFISVLFVRGNFDMADKLTTSTAFIGYISFMLAFGFIEVLNKAYYSLENRRTPIIITAIVTSLNLIISFLIVKFVGFIAIPISTSIAYFIGAILSTYIFLNEDKSGARRLLKTILKTIIASALMGVVVYLFKTFVYNSGVFALVLNGIVGIIIYFISIVLLKESLLIFNLKKALRIFKKTI